MKLIRTVSLSILLAAVSLLAQESRAQCEFHYGDTTRRASGHYTDTDLLSIIRVADAAFSGLI